MFGFFKQSQEPPRSRDAPRDNESCAPASSPPPPPSGTKTTGHKGGGSTGGNGAKKGDDEDNPFLFSSFMKSDDKSDGGSRRRQQKATNDSLKGLFDDSDDSYDARPVTSGKRTGPVAPARSSKPRKNAAHPTSGGDDRDDEENPFSFSSFLDGSKSTPQQQKISKPTPSTASSTVATKTATASSQALPTLPDPGTPTATTTVQKKKKGRSQAMGLFDTTTSDVDNVFNDFPASPPSRLRNKQRRAARGDNGRTVASASTAREGKAARRVPKKNGGDVVNDDDENPFSFSSFLDSAKGTPAKSPAPTTSTTNAATSIPSKTGRDHAPLGPPPPPKSSTPSALPSSFSLHDDSSWNSDDDSEEEDDSFFNDLAADKKGSVSGATIPTNVSPDDEDDDSFFNDGTPVRPTAKCGANGNNDGDDKDHDDDDDFFDDEDDEDDALIVPGSSAVTVAMSLEDRLASKTRELELLRSKRKLGTVQRTDRLQKHSKALEGLRKKCADEIARSDELNRRRVRLTRQREKQQQQELGETKELEKMVEMVENRLKETTTSAHKAETNVKRLEGKLKLIQAQVQSARETRKARTSQSRAPNDATGVLEQQRMARVKARDALEMMEEAQKEVAEAVRKLVGSARLAREVAGVLGSMDPEEIDNGVR
eukprot:TRINITY_DN6929_c0_g1_i1.p1 TRINITY_DN6929_c0_g1~~TRINITY_DN6929_c0_g1_i1.p1  ORF type:complete len:654 (-),score=212.17 TRINITY_DN6929_c0_g1_i1:81-2042(-)